MTISEKVAYLKGLAEGLELDTVKSKEAKLISEIIGILEDVVFDDDDEDEDDDDFFEVECPNCGAEIDIDEDILDAGSVECPACGEKFAIDLCDDDDCCCGHSHEDEKE